MDRGLEIARGDGPLVATAIHAGHSLRPDIARLMALDEASRLREEDPYTDVWTRVVPNRIVVSTSRFEVDLNRPREQAVYRSPDDAWGLEVWRDGLPVAERERSLALYDDFYGQAEQLLTELVARHGQVVVLDLHSYCHRRGGPEAAPADPAGNPEINVGTGSVDRGRWGALVDRLCADLRACTLAGHPLDVRENVKFQGGNFVRWIHRTFPESVCGLALEMKKSFMDEWTGDLDTARHRELGAALQASLPGLLEELTR